MEGNQMKLLVTAFLCSLTLVLGETDPQDVQVLNDFRNGLKNPELLKWPSRGDPCGDKWPHVFCSGSRVTQIQIQNLGVEGSLPPNFNKLSMLESLGFQHNKFTGPLPSFSGLSELQDAYLGNNEFDTIPSDFFDGLDKLQVMSLDYSPLNKTTGWSIPNSLENSAQLMNLSLMGCNLIGPLPEFLGGMSSLTALKLSYNKITGSIPASYTGAQLQTLWLNNQDGVKMSGPIDIVASMVSLRELWLHGNGFTGTIPLNIGDCTGLTDLLLNDNQLVGPIPASITSLPLESLSLDNNMLMGPIPSLKIKFSFSGNKFCQPSPGIPCAPEVTALLDFLAGVNYPTNLALAWSGNNPCTNWLGIACMGGKVSAINLPKFKLNGTLSSSVGKLNSVARIVLQGNNLHGTIPTTLSGLKSLRLLDLSGNNFVPPVPKFSSTVNVIIDGNPKLTGAPPKASPSPSISPSSPPRNSESPTGGNSGDNSSPSSPPRNSESPAGGNSGDNSSPSSPPRNSESPAGGNSGDNSGAGSSGNSADNSGTGSNSGDNSGDSGPSLTPKQKGSKTSNLVYITIPVAFVLGGALLVGLVMFVCWKKKHASEPTSSVVIHPKDSSSDPDNMLKIVIASNNNISSSNATRNQSHSINSSGTNEAHLIEAGNLVISVQVLRNVTRNFAPENELGRGGFGAVYKGELDDGTIIAVKRMEASVISNKASDEFQAEIAVLSKVRHRHLVSLLGYSVEGNEKLLVYEYMPQGALSKHLFHWKRLNLEPLSWKRRLNIALDVARGMEYLHSLAHQSFIHRDLKSSNILLGDDYHAKVSDFGLVKLAPDGQESVVTRLAGTFGYLAPEYAVTGKVTTKVDVFSFGVVLMEMITGLTALDEGRQEERRYLAEWFRRIKSSRDKLMQSIDPSLDVTEETFESISIIAELAGHCTAGEPNQRPDMGHSVNVLAPMVEKWMPTYSEQEEYMGIDCSQPLHQMVKDWQETDGADHSMTGPDDSKGSIPARPTGFAESFTSADGR